MRGFGSENTDQRLAYFHLVAGTCPTNSSHAGTSIICGDKSRGLVPRIQTWFDFVEQVAGTKSLVPATKFLMKMGSSREGTWSPGLVPSCVPTLKHFFMYFLIHFRQKLYIDMMKFLFSSNQSAIRKGKLHQNYKRLLPKLQTRNILESASRLGVMTS